MSAYVNVNGRISPERDAVVPVFDHGFLYGEGVYETIRTYNGRPLLFVRHLRRLRQSADMIQLAVPFSDDEFETRVNQTLTAARRSWPADGPQEAYIRILYTRGVGDLTYDPAACPAPSVVIIVKPQIDPPREVFERGVKVALVDIIRNHPASVNPLIKSNNLLNNALAMQEALRRGAYEAIMRNFRGELAECTQSNLFIVSRGEALTPPLESGLLAGITREFVFEVGRDASVSVRAAVVRESDLFGADEAFLTSTTREIVPIVRVDEKLIGTGKPGPITGTLLEAFRRRVNDLTTMRAEDRSAAGRGYRSA